MDMIRTALFCVNCKSLGHVYCVKLYKTYSNRFTGYKLFTDYFVIVQLINDTYGIKDFTATLTLKNYF